MKLQSRKWYGTKRAGLEWLVAETSDSGRRKSQKGLLSILFQKKQRKIIAEMSLILRILRMENVAVVLKIIQTKTDVWNQV